MALQLVACWGGRESKHWARLVTALIADTESDPRFGWLSLACSTHWENAHYSFLAHTLKDCTHVLYKHTSPTPTVAWCKLVWRSQTQVRHILTLFVNGTANHSSSLGETCGYVDPKNVPYLKMNWMSVMINPGLWLALHGLYEFPPCSDPSCLCFNYTQS